MGRCYAEFIMRFFRLSLFLFLFLTVMASLWRLNPSKVLAKDGGLPILLYHYVGPLDNPGDSARKALSVTLQDFEAQMNYLQANGFEPVTLGYLPYVFEGRQSLSGKKPVLLTFDDGYMDFYFNAFPILKKFGFHAVSFIPTGKMNGSYYLTWEQIKEIRQSGLVEFEDHTVNHVNLAAASGDQIRFELGESKSVLERETGQPVSYLAYPYGAVSGQVIETAKSLGYVGAFVEGDSRAYSLGFTVPRFRINGYTTLGRFEDIVNGRIVSLLPVYLKPTGSNTQENKSGAVSSRPQSQAAVRQPDSGSSASGPQQRVPFGLSLPRFCFLFWCF